MVSPPSCSCSSSQPSVYLLGTHFASACPATSISAAMIAAPPPNPRISASCSADCLLKILVEFAKKLLRCQPRLIGTDQIGRATSELQSLMRISYAVFCLKKKNNNRRQI